ncbi:O-methyltransferase family 2 [Colletotrichum musicola]|uniref:O-methyltransferase family 2 n=1 Tax=Colletotrichum musicola TaxID=2175873 RepID=A0A8H6NPT1_9PEZI|nr:O-methyltransferase family 2 [Colletotrichum musicola]
MPALIEFPRRGAEEILRVEYISPRLFKLTLPQHNKAAIFADAIERLESGREETDLILRNLRAWAPDVAASFRARTPDVVLDTPFRLVCHGPTDSDDDSPAGIPFDCRFVVRQFLAVSYSWHSPSWPERTPISAPEPGGVWPVGRRFADAILALRGHPREGVWMDQICINQADEDEKQRAIACMVVIYRSCRRLVVLLEDVELTDAEAALPSQYDNLATVAEHNAVPRDERDVPLFISMFDKVAAARWWQRAWCFHEFVVGEPWSDKRFLDVHQTVFVMGLEGGRTCVVDCLKLRLLLSAVMIKLQHRSPLGKHLEPVLSGFAQRTSPLHDSPVRRAGATKASFLGRFNAVVRTDCSVPGDRLSICINLVGLGIAYFRDAGEEPCADDTFYHAILLALAAGEKRPLAFANQEALVVRGRRSWLERPVAATDTTWGKFTLGGIKGLHEISVGRMVIDMVFLESPWETCNDEDVKVTYDIFPDTIPSTQPPLKAGGMRGVHLSYTNEELDAPRRRFLAAVVAAGPRFLRRLWPQLERDVVQGNYNSGNFGDFVANDDLGPSAEALLRALDAGEEEEDTVDAETALLFITWVTDPRSISWISWLVSRIRCTRDGEEALLTYITWTSHFQGYDKAKQALVAVPTDLLKEDCVLTRAWLVVPAGDRKREGEWTVVAKALLLGEPDLEEQSLKVGDDGESDAGVRLRKRQTILA